MGKLAKIDPDTAPGMLSVERARAWLAKAVAVDEVKSLRDKAEAIAAYQRKQKSGREAALDAEKIVVFADARIGELSRELPKTGPKGGRPKHGHDGHVKRETLASLGLSQREAARCEALAAIPEAKRSRMIDAEAAKGRRVTTRSLLGAVAVEKKSAFAAKLRAEPVPTPDGRFRVIVIDPPWQYETRAADTSHRGRNRYPDMSIEEICALPVGELAEDDCILWLWTTNAFMHEAYHCLNAWGFTPKTILTWDKVILGLGDWLRNVTEHCIVATRGKPIVTLTNQTTMIREQRGQHSRKPDAFYALVDALCPGSKLEMFARSPRDGWERWGAEA